MFYYDYKTIEIRQYSKKYKKWFTKTPQPNIKLHPKGIIGKCIYYQVSLSIPHKPTKGVPMHRIVYAWFNDIIEPYNENNEKMEICHNERFDDIWKDNHILNLRWDTAKNNRAERKGAINQYGTRKEKYGIEVLNESIK